MTDLRGMRLRVRESKYDDLRQLEAAIREAYVAKELQAQVIEAEAERTGAQARERLMTEMLKRKEEEAAKIAEEENQVKKLAKINYGIELQMAISSKKKERALSLEFERKERRILEEVSRVIEETQETRELSKKLEFAERRSNELRIFREIKEIRLQKEAEETEAKEKRNLEYLEEIERRTEEMKKVRKERELAREAVIETIAKSLLESQVKMLKIETIIADLLVEEKYFEEERKLREEIERQKNAREEAAAEMERHRILVEERKLRNAIEEEEFAAAVMRRVLEDSMIEKLTLEAKKRRQIEYRDSLDKIIEERRSRRIKDIVKLEETLRLDRKRAEDFRKRVKETRERLIALHGANVAEFIAKKALSREEREVLSEIIDNLEKPGMLN